jgi:hypothetical protein
VPLLGRRGRRRRALHGLVAWSLGAGSTIDGTPVHGRKVVSVTAHGSRRRGGTSSTVVFVDHEATPTQARLLATAFAGGWPVPSPSWPT